MTAETYADCAAVLVNFTEAELACRHCGRGLYHPDFLRDLQALRVVFGRAMHVNSCARCAAHNAAIGGHPRSFHKFEACAHGAEGTLAIDVKTEGMGLTYRGDLFVAAWRLGWSIGWGKGFLHLDRRIRLGLPQVTFDY